MKFTEYLFFTALWLPTAAVLTAAAICLAMAANGMPSEIAFAPYTHLEHQP